MPITREKKENVVGLVTKNLGQSAALVFVNFHGLSVAEQAVLRRALRAQGAEYQVVKKSLLRRALSTQGYEGEMPELLGEVAIAWGTDAVVPAREVFLFGKTREGKAALVGGVLEGRYLSATEVLTLAKTPSREELYGKLVGTLHAVPSSFVRTLDAVPSSFVRTLAAIASR
jgi:large subunit ribosomal protein L10